MTYEEIDKEIEEAKREITELGKELDNLKSSGFLLSTKIDNLKIRMEQIFKYLDKE